MLHDVWFLSVKAKSGTIKPAALGFVSNGRPLFSLARVNHRVNEAWDMSYVICWMWSVNPERAKPHYLHMMECYVTYARTMIWHMSSSCLVIWFRTHCVAFGFHIQSRGNPADQWFTLTLAQGGACCQVRGILHQPCCFNLVNHGPRVHRSTVEIFECGRCSGTRPLK